MHNVIALADIEIRVWRIEGSATRKYGGFLLSICIPHPTFHIYMP